MSPDAVIYAIANDGPCKSLPVEIMLDVDYSLTATSTSLETCDDGNGTGVYILSNADFVVTGGNGSLSVVYYEDAGATVQINDIDNYDAGNTTIYAVVEMDGCVSAPVPIDLSLIPSIESFDAMEEICEENNGAATFNLTDLDATINGGNGMDVIWYTDAQGTNAISDPTQFTTTPTVIYAVVTNGACDSEIASIQLDVTVIDAIDTDLFTCDEGSGIGTFNLDEADEIINNNTGNFVSWYSDAGLTNSISGSDAYMSSNGFVYAVVSDGICFSDPVEIELAVVTNLEAAPAELAECEVSNGESFFNLEGANSVVNINSGLDVEWFLDAAGTMPINNPDNYFGSGGTVYAQVVDGSCRSLIQEVNLEVVQKPETNQFDHEECDDGTGSATFNLTSLSENVNNEGYVVTWYEDALLTNPISGNFYSGNTTIYAVVSNGNCDSDPVDINISVVEAKESFEDFTLCPGETVTVGSVIFDESYSAGPVLLAGASAAGCDSIINVTVEFADLIANVDIVDPACFGEINGQIFGSAIGGLEPYVYSIGDAFSVKNGFTNLAPGTYTLTVQDATGCEADTTFTLTEPDQITVELGDNILIDLGETVDLTANTNLDQTMIDTIIWTSTDTLTCKGICLQQLNLSPVTSTTYTIQIIDIYGCVATDFITVNVQRQLGVFIPNTFTPNGDGTNNKFTVFGNENKVELVQHMSIYDRWGNRVFELENFPANVESIGWDGTFKGENLEPAVFIYVVEVLFKDGSIEQYAGDLTLIR